VNPPHSVHPIRGPTGRSRVMCGRYSLASDLAELQLRFGFVTDLEALEKRYNIAPTQPAPVVVLRDGVPVLSLMRWGLVPSWRREEKGARPIINARAEGIENKPTFKHLLSSRRCLVLADGFYEWGGKREGRLSARVPYRFTLRSGEPFAFAGLWDVWRAPTGGGTETFTIITTGANELVGRIHDRMPAILDPETALEWIDARREWRELRAMLKPYPSSEMTAYRVSELVNSPRNDSPQCIVPAVGEPTTQD